MQQLRNEWAAQKPGVLFDDAPPTIWKSIVMQYAGDSYRELYFIIDDVVYVRPLTRAYMTTVGSDHLLVTNDPVDGHGHYCTGGIWVLKRAGPWMKAAAVNEPGCLASPADSHRSK